VATPRVIKQILSGQAVQWLLSAAAAGYVRVVRWTSGLDRPEPPPGGPFILATWHSRLLLLADLRHGRPLTALISGNRDGQLISKIASFYGIRSVGGSSSRDGSKALRELIRLARAGHSLYITPDGPRGPRMKVQPGVIGIARMTGLPILPASASATRGFEGRSWDRFFVPYPFGRIIIRWGEPIVIARDSDPDAELAKIETVLTALQERADDAAGRGHPAEDA
jgi:lysophospholipid acyltransferase (LPLAT)-like uncharacterized protein